PVRDEEVSLIFQANRGGVTLIPSHEKCIELRSACIASVDGGTEILIEESGVDECLPRRVIVCPVVKRAHGGDEGVPLCVRVHVEVEAGTTEDVDEGPESVERRSAIEVLHLECRVRRSVPPGDNVVRIGEGEGRLFYGVVEAGNEAKLLIMPVYLCCDARDGGIARYEPMVGSKQAPEHGASRSSVERLCARLHAWRAGLVPFLREMLPPSVAVPVRD